MKRTALLALLAGSVALPAMADTFDEAALVDQAKTEPPLVVYDSTGKIREQAQAFAEKYGLQATGTKSKVTQTIKILSGEEKSGNVQTDVVILSDIAAADAQLIKPGYTVNYVPSDMTTKVPANEQDPLILSTSVNLFAYNTKLNDSCPVTNIWQLTEPEWKGHVAMQDPMGKPAYTDFFNQLATHYDAKVAAAYEDLYGNPLKTDQESATAAWVAALAANNPLLTHSDNDAAQAVGAPDATENFMGVLSTGKFRENENGMKLGICAGVAPFSGWQAAKMIAIAKDAPSPAAAKLFVHYMLTKEGYAPQAIDGKISTNPDVGIPSDEPSGVANYLDQMMPSDPKTVSDDWSTRQDWQDLWQISRMGS